MIEHGYCQCGCGNQTLLATQTHRKYGHIKDEPMRFIVGHNLRNYHGRLQDSHNWKGGKVVDKDGYIGILNPLHKRARSSGYVLEHIIVIEKALGKPIPINSVPHHVDEDRSNNKNNNLVLCNDRAYHNLLHRRIRALRACGHAHWRICNYCHEHDDPESLYVSENGRAIYHRKCNREHQKRIVAKQKLYD